MNQDNAIKSISIQKMEEVFREAISGLIGEKYEVDIISLELLAGEEGHLTDTTEVKLRIRRPHKPLGFGKNLQA